MDITEQLKKHSPTSLKVELRDGSHRAVAIARAGNRWAKVRAVLEALDWVQIECLDKDGRVLAVIESDEEEEPEELAALGDVGLSGSLLAQLARTMMEVQRSTLKEVRQMFDSQLKGMADLCGAMTDGLRNVSQSYQTALQVQAAHLAAPQGEDHSEVMNMMKMAMMLKMGSSSSDSNKGG